MGANELLAALAGIGRTSSGGYSRLSWDPATGVMRHADAGYEIARAAAREHGLNLPSLKA